MEWKNGIAGIYQFRAFDIKKNVVFTITAAKDKSLVKVKHWYSTECTNEQVNLYARFVADNLNVNVGIVGSTLDYVVDINKHKYGPRSASDVGWMVLANNGLIKDKFPIDIVDAAFNQSTKMAVANSVASFIYSSNYEFETKVPFASEYYMGNTIDYEVFYHDSLSDEVGLFIRFDGFDRDMIVGRFRPLSDTLKGRLRDLYGLCWVGSAPKKHIIETCSTVSNLFIRNPEH